MTVKLSVALASAALLALGSGAALAQPQPDMTPGPSSHEGVRATRALNLLEASGDGQYYNFTASGRDFMADVVRDGRPTRVEIDPAAGKVTALASAGQPVAPTAAPRTNDPGMVTYWDGHPDVKTRLPGAPY